MTEQEIDALEAGRELDILIATRLFGWEWHDSPDGNTRAFLPPGARLMWLGKKYQGNLALWDENLKCLIGRNLPKFSTTWEGAGMVWDGVSEKYGFLSLDFELGHWFATVIELDNGEAYTVAKSDGETAALAICRTALKAAIQEAMIQD